MRSRLLGPMLALFLITVLTGCGKKINNSEQQSSQNSIMPSDDEIAQKAFRSAVDSNRASDLMKAFLEYPNIDINKFFDNGETPLSYSIKEDLTQSRNFLIELGANLEKTNINRETPLIAAVLKNRLNSLKVLLDKNVELDKRDFNGNTALHSALANKQEEIALLLIKQGARIDLNDSNEKSPYQLSIDNHLIQVQEMIQSLMQVEFGTPDISSFRNVLLMADMPGLNRMLTRYPKIVNEYISINPLVLIFEVKDLNYRQLAIQLLLSYNTNVNGPVNAPTTPLIKAVQNQSQALTQLFLNAGADPVLTDDLGKSPLIYAVELNNPKLVSLLLNHAALEKYTIRKNGQKYSYNACTIARAIEKTLTTKLEIEKNQQIKDKLNCFNWFFF
ncbi:MAG: ankyrin repeat domain-containing protein [Bacteriovoracaceae bacterium]